MNNSKRYYDVLAKIRKYCHKRDKFYINQEKEQIKLYEKCQHFLILDPAADTEEHDSKLAKLLLFKNLYRKLYLYLQGAVISELESGEQCESSVDGKIWNLKKDDSFLQVQKEELKLQMGLFAYADATENWSLRYLYGPQDLPRDKLKTNPHFYIKPFYCHEKEKKPGYYEFKEVDKYGFWDHSRTLYYGRTNRNYRELDFVQILQANENNPGWERRTTFERDMDIIYASEGEMGSCTLGWLMLFVNPEHTNKLDSTLAQIEKTKELHLLKDIKFNFQLKKRKLTTTVNLTAEPEPLVPWIAAQREESLFYWLHKLGLTKSWDSENEVQITERGIRLVKWLALYLRSLGGEEINILGNKEPFFYRIIGGAQKLDEKDFPTEFGSQLIRDMFNYSTKKDSPAYEIFRLMDEKTIEKIRLFVESSVKEPELELLQSVFSATNKILENSMNLPWEKWQRRAEVHSNITEKLKNIREPFCRRLIILQAYFPVLNKQQKLFPSWLDGIDTKLVEQFIRKIENTSKIPGILELLQAVNLFLKWQQKENGDGFKRRCRFNLLGHLTLRAGRQNLENIETASRAWLVFPVHYDYTDYQENSGVTSVGFFLGTFKDSSDVGDGYFENFHEIGTKLTERIFKIRHIMDLLAQVENREIYIKDIYNIQIQEAMENQHKWTIHEIRNEIASIKGYIYDLENKDVKIKPEEVVQEFSTLKNNYDEFEIVLNWVTELMNGKKIEGDEQWIDNEDFRWAFDAFVMKMMGTAEMCTFLEIKKEDELPLFETNHDVVFKLSDTNTVYELPFFTYQKLIHELAKNIMKYADRSRKCYFMFDIDDQFLTIETKNIYFKNETEMLSTGKGLELFDRFLKVYNSKSYIDRSGLFNRNFGDQCKCIAKIAIKKRRK